MYKPSYLIHKSQDDQIYFVLRAENHEVVLTSETYTRLSDAKNGIESVRRHAVQTGNFRRELSRRGEPYFVLVADNHEIIGVSEMYSSAQKCDQGIDAVMRCAPLAEVEDRRE